MRIQLSPFAAIGISVSMFVVLTLCTTVAALNGHGISLNENQILYLFSTSAEVIAAIYGLTLTGFIFFRNELSREESEDETLVEAVESLKRRYFALLLFIAGLVTLTLLLANLAIVHEGSGEARLNTIIINAGQSAFVTSPTESSPYRKSVMSRHSWLSNHAQRTRLRRTIIGGYH